MKQSDIFSVIIIATVGTLAAYFGVNALMGDPNMEHVDIKTIEPISSSLTEPDPELFNPSAINPTVEIMIGDCEDADKNGFLSKEELIKCGKIDQEEIPTEEESEIVYCPDGTIVLGTLEDCSNNKKVVPEETLNGTTH